MNKAYTFTTSDLLRLLVLVTLSVVLLLLGTAPAYGQKNSSPTKVEKGGAKIEATSAGNVTISAKPGGSVTISPAPAGVVPGMVYTSQAATFAAALTAAANKTLVVDASTTVSTSTTIPATVALRIEPGGMLSVNSGQVLTILTPNVTAGRYQIFAGSGTVRFTGPLPDPLCPEWWGAKADNATDDLAAFNKMTAAVQTGTSAHVVLNPTSYLSAAWNVDFAGTIEGLGPGSGYNSPHLRFAANSPGVIVHDLSTKTGINDSRLARHSTLKNLIISGAVGSTTHTGTIATAGGVITLTRSSGGSFSDAGGYHEGNSISVSNSDAGTYEYLIDTYVSANSVTLKKPRLYVAAKNGSNVIYNSNGSSNSYLSSWFVGQTITIAGSTYTVSAVDNTITSGAGGYGRATLTTNVSGLTDNTTSFICGNFGGASSCYLGDATANGATAGTAKNLRPNLSHGLDARTLVNIEQVYVDGFAGNCLNLDSSFGPTAFPGTQPNQNVSRISRSSFYNCYGNGIYTKSTNSNQMLIEATDATNNRGAGYFEGSFLGNHYLAIHASFDLQGGFVEAQNGVNLSSCIGCYTEGGMPSSWLNQHSFVLSGDHGAGITGPGGFLQHLNGWTLLDSLRISTGRTDSKLIGVGVGDIQLNQPNTLFGIGAAEDGANTAVGGTSTNLQRFPYQLGYDQLSTGWYNLYYGGNYATSQANSVFAFSGSTATEGAGKAWLYNGTYVGEGQNRVFVNGAGTGLAITNGPTLNEGLVATAIIDYNNTTYQTVFTNSTSKKFIPTKIVVGEATEDVSSITFRCRNSVTSLVIYSAALSALADFENYDIAIFATGGGSSAAPARIDAGASLQCKPNTPSGSPTTARADVFGYFY